MKHLHTMGVALLHLIAEALLWCLRTYINAQVRFDRKVLKRYLGIETPFYRIWHSQNVKIMQRKLNREHNYELGMAM